MGWLDGLPWGWKSAKDPQGKTYYYNERTGVTQYDKPARGGAPVVKKALAIGYAPTNSAGPSTPAGPPATQGGT